MHVWGAAAFGLALVVKLLDLGIYRRLILACLWGEIILLGWQVLSAPCSECLLVGCIWGAVAWLAMREPAYHWVDHRIRARIFICVMYLQLHRLMRSRLH